MNIFVLMTIKPVILNVNIVIKNLQQNKAHSIHIENSCKQNETIKKQKQLENTSIINNLMEKLIVKDTQIQNLKDNAETETGSKTYTEIKTKYKYQL